MRIAFFSNLLARSFIVFLISYLWLSFYIRNIVLVFLIAFCIMLGVNIIFNIFVLRRNTRIALNRKQQEHLAEIGLQLKFQSRQKTVELLRDALQKRGKETECTKRKVKFTLDEKTINLFPLFNTEPTAADIIICVKFTTKEAITYVAAAEFSPAVRAFAASLDKKIVLLDIGEIYTQLLAPAEIFPDISVRYKSKAKLTWAGLKQAAFAHTKARGYVFMGFIVLATSFIVRFNIYYIIAATVLFSFGAVSLFMVPSKDVLV